MAVDDGLHRSVSRVGGVVLPALPLVPNGAAVRLHVALEAVLLLHLRDGEELAGAAGLGVRVAGRVGLQRWVRQRRVRAHVAQRLPARHNHRLSFRLADATCSNTEQGR